MIQNIKSYLQRINPRSPIFIVGVFSIVLLLLIAITFSARVSDQQQTSTIAQITPSPTPMPLIPGKDFVEGQIVVKFKDGVSDVVINEQLRKSNASIKSTIQGINATVISVPVGQEESVRSQLTKAEIVKYAEPDYVMHALFVPNDTYFGNQYGLNNTGQNIQGQVGNPNADIHIKEAWDVTKGAGVKVAIIDTGIDLNHPDLAGKVVLQKTLVTSSIDDKFGHGTHIAGIIAANTNNGKGIAGTCPECQLIIAKAADDRGSSSTSIIAEGFIWAADNNAKVISISLGRADFNAQVLSDGVAYAWGKNVVIVASAGNCGGSNYLDQGCYTQNPLIYPAAYPHVVSVAATDNKDQKVAFSENGSWVQIAAPGYNIFSTLPTQQSVLGTNYAYLSGTSQAAPMVSGVAALIWSTRYGTSNQAVVDRLLSTADRIAGSGTYWQSGRVNAAAAVATASASPSPSVGPTISVTPPTSPSATIVPSPSIPFVCGGSKDSICNPSTTVSPNPTISPRPTISDVPNVTVEPSVSPSISPVPDNDCLDPRSTPEKINDWVKGFLKKIGDYIQLIMGNPQNSNRPAPPRPCIKA